MLANQNTGEIITYSALEELDQVIPMIQEELEGGDISPSDLERIKIPTQGSLIWSVPDIDEPEGFRQTRELQAIIIHHRKPRAFWQRPFEKNGGGQLPDCASPDGITGIGDIGTGYMVDRDCSICPMNAWRSVEWVTGVPGPGKACKETSMLFALLPDGWWPNLVTASPGSINNVRRYFRALGGKKQRPHHVITGLKLVGAHNQNNLLYSQIAPYRMAVLGEEARTAVLKLREILMPLMEAQAIQREEVDGPINTDYGHHHVAPAPNIDQEKPHADSQDNV